MNPASPQLELFTAKVPAVSGDDLEWMKGELRGQDWRTAANLGALDENRKRKLRAICRASHGLIISGPKGYRLTWEVSHAEYHRCRDRLKAYADDLMAHVAELDIVFHRRPQTGEAEG